MDSYSAYRPDGQKPAAASSSSVSSSGSATPSARVTPSSSSSQIRLSHSISSLADFNQFDLFDVYQPAAVPEQNGDGTKQNGVGASVMQSNPSPSDRRSKLRGQESLESLVYDESLGAYTKAAVPAIPSTAPATASSHAPVPAPTSAPSSVTSTPSYTPYSPDPTPYQPSTTGPAPYSAYDSTYGSAAAPTSSTGFFSGGASGPSSPKPNMGRRLSSMLSSRRRGSRVGGQPYDTIQEEEPHDGGSGGGIGIGMASLVQNAAPISQEPSGSIRAYSRIEEPGTEDVADTADVGVDLTSYSGPWTGQDEALLKNLNAQEANGKLTLGLGAGFGPGTRLRESDLLAGSPVVSSSATPVSPTASLARSLSRRWTSSSSPMMSPLSSPLATSNVQRRSTVRALAQEEANRRGEIVEVIIEEEDEGPGGSAKSIGSTITHSSSRVDLSVVSGTEGPDLQAGNHQSMAERRRSALPRSATQVFYPQPNWRPFSMRWPYLSALLLLSIGLGVGQECLYRMTINDNPLIEFKSPSEIPSMQYFAVKFVPTIVAVTFGILWQVTDFEVKRLEAFYQLSKEGGALADDSINVDYVTYIAFLRPFRALYCRHYAVAVSSIVSLLAVSLVPTLSAASIVLTPDRDERRENPQGSKAITVNATWSRVLTAVYFVVAALGVLLFWLLHRRRSGLVSDVRGIAGLASMAVVSHIMTDFKGMDLASHQEIHKQLENRRYVLCNSSLAQDDDHEPSLAEIERYKDFDSHMSQNPHPLMLRAVGCVPYICGIVIFAGLVPIVLFTPANVLTDKTPWVLTAFAVSIKLGWGGLETAVRVMEPYHILWKRHAPAKTLTLDYTAMPFVFVAGQALLNRHWLVFFVGFATILTELLTVLVTSLATVEGHNFIGERAQALDDGESHITDSGEETARTFWLSLGLTLLILAYMSIVATVVFVRRRRTLLPRQPNTISSVLAYIHQSKMLWNFVGTSKMNNRQMLAKLEESPHTYGLGWFQGRDGKTHCGVDQEELLKGIDSRVNYSWSNQPWQDAGV